ncbi:MAG: sialidase family protein [Solirubrobacteraceae bacterium]
MKRALLTTAMLATALGVASPATAEPFGVLTPATLASTDNPFPAGCGGPGESSGTAYNYDGTEVEPYVAVNPTDAKNVVVAWQQDRWSDGGAHGLNHRYSIDGGLTFATSNPPFSKCAGGKPFNLGDFERSSDPWVSFGPTGTLYAISISFDDSTARNAVLINRSLDGGATWKAVNDRPQFDNPRAIGNNFSDKESLTADPGDPAYAYAIWDRLVSPSERSSATAYQHGLGYRGPTYFSRTTDGGDSWSAGRKIYDPGEQNQTIGNQIVVSPDGTLVDGFDLIYNRKNAGKRRGLNVAIIRSYNKGVTWESKPTIVAPLRAIGVTDPEPVTGCRPLSPDLVCRDVRTGDIIPEIAVDRSNKATSGNLYMVWQEHQSSPFGDDTILLSRSVNGGTSWSEPIKVNATPTGVYNTQAFTAQVQVDDQGRVTVTYYDMRADQQAGGLDTQFWAVHSDDGGSTFGNEQELTNGAFDMRQAPYARGYFVGDYTGLGVFGSAFTPLWVQTSTAQGNDAYIARIG